MLDQIYLDRIETLCVRLESGQYKQARGVLHRIYANGTHGYCCLGVASVEARLGGLDITVVQRRAIGSAHDMDEYFDGCGTLPPNVVTDYYGWDSRDPMLLAEDGYRYSASVLNDHGDGATSVPYTFAQIAAAFRRTFGLPQPQVPSGS